MNSGGRNRRVTLLRNEQTRDAANELTDSWVEVDRAWASILHTSGIQAIKAGAERPIVKASIRLRYRRDIVMGMRVQHNTDFYEVEAALPDEDRRERVDLVCRLLSAAELAP